MQQNRNFLKKIIFLNLLIRKTPFSDIGLNCRIYLRLHINKIDN